MHEEVFQVGDRVVTDDTVRSELQEQLGTIVGIEKEGGGLKKIWVLFDNVKSGGTSGEYPGAFYFDRNKQALSLADDGIDEAVARLFGLTPTREFKVDAGLADRLESRAKHLNLTVDALLHRIIEKHLEGAEE